ncbi:FAD:protein FMN transferase [Clostridium sp. SHJSY1]|uniref:FAD:protein FMN transferase n=1 Tax=Clostridium sp. SHJSY1 TaxID=2942483 RepID=UPI002874A71C|nr:FAD:protein FMN transferase [Clostridium sp. SHJSY1]
MVLIVVEIILVILLISILILVFFTRKKPNIISEKSFFVLGTIIYLKAFGKNAEKAINEAIECLINIDDKMSVFKDNSEISRINKNAGISSQVVSKDTFYLIDKSIKYSELLEGTFDPTIKPLVSLWGIGTKSQRIPSNADIKDKLALVNYKDIILNRNDNSIALKRQNQSIDVGGIAKGYAADEVITIFKKYSIKSALIDLGGNIFVLGTKDNDSFWNVGIQNPFGTRGEYIGILSLKDKSIVTSGNYERYFTKGNDRFHHIIDPHTGYPSKSRIISATIISDKSLDGDGLSTGVYIMGVEKSLNIIESLDGIDAIFITEDKNIYLTSGINANFKLSNDEFICN